MKYRFFWIGLSAVAITLALLTGCNQQNPAEEPRDTQTTAQVPPAPSDTVPSEPLRYSLNEDGASYSVSGVEPTATWISIPAVHEDLPVTGIGEGAFAHRVGLIDVIIPDSVTSIGASAFEGCSALKSVSIPHSVTKIGKKAFFDCQYLTVVTMGKGVSSVGNDAFAACPELKDVYVTDAVAWLGISFGESSYSCPNYAATLHILGPDGKEMTDLVIPDTVTAIRPYALKNGTSLRTVTLSKQMTELGDQAFFGCINLEELVLPDCVTSIGTQALAGCESLSSIVIPNGVTHLGRSAFADCTALTRVTVGSGVTEIGERAFWNCKSLGEVTLSEGIESIGSYAFGYCTSLTDIAIPQSVTAMGTAPLRGCSALTDLMLPLVGRSTTAAGPSVSTLLGTVFGTERYEGGIETRQYYNSTSFATYYIPAPLRSVTVSGGAIPYGAFYGCGNLTKVTLLEGVTEIGSRAFFGCTRLCGIDIPSSVTSIGTRVFANCESLSYIRVDKKNLTYRDSGNCLLQSTTLIAGCQNSIIPADGSVRAIGSLAFEGCTGLTVITVPDAIREIGVAAFYGCSSLTSMTLPFIGRSNYGQNGSSSLGTIFGTASYSGGVATKQYSDWYCRDIYYIPASLRSVTVTRGPVPYGAFSGCKGLTDVTFSKNVTSIGEAIFADCMSLTNITVEEGNPVYHSVDHCIVETESKRLVAGYYDSVIPEDGSVTSIGDRAFFGCSGLTSVHLPEGVLSVGEGAFMGCSALTDLYLPDSVRVIDGYAFYGCYKLSDLILPSDLRQIGQYAFENCGNIETVFYNGYKEQWQQVTPDRLWLGIPYTVKVICFNGTIQLHEDYAVWG